MASQVEIRESITNRIIESLTTPGKLPAWRRPWGDGVNCGMPANAMSKKSYRGVNVLLLSCQPFQSRWWATYRQWRDLGCQVRKGEHGTRIVFWRRVEREVVNDAGEVEKDEYLLLREYCVFSVEQCEGKGVEKFLVRPGTEGNKDFVDFGPAEEAIQATGADIRFGGNKAVYYPGPDFIQMPVKSAFESEQDYYGTAFHELGHWTGHESRLDRLNKNAKFGDMAYSFEELCAELAGAFACNELGIPQSDDLSNHQAYLAHWLGILQQDHGAILRAAGQASRAVDFILAFCRGREEAGECDHPLVAESIEA